MGEERLTGLALLHVLRDIGTIKCGRYYRSICPGEKKIY